MLEQKGKVLTGKERTDPDFDLILKHFRVKNTLYSRWVKDFYTLREEYSYITLRDLGEIVGETMTRYDKNFRKLLNWKGVDMYSERGRQLQHMIGSVAVEESKRRGDINGDP